MGSGELFTNYGNGRIEKREIDGNVLGICGGKQRTSLWGENTFFISDYVPDAYNSYSNMYTDIYYWKCSDSFSIFDFYYGSVQGKSPEELYYPGIQNNPEDYRHWQTANVEEDLRNNDSSIRFGICDLYYYARDYTSTISDGESTLVYEQIAMSADVEVFQNGIFYHTLLVVPRENVTERGFSFETLEANDFYWRNLLWDLDAVQNEGVFGNILFSNKEINVLYNPTLLQGYGSMFDNIGDIRFNGHADDIVYDLEHNRLYCKEYKDGKPDRIVLYGMTADGSYDFNCEKEIQNITNIQSGVECYGCIDAGLIYSVGDILYLDGEKICEYKEMKIIVNGGKAFLESPDEHNLKEIIGTELKDVSNPKQGKGETAPSNGADIMQVDNMGNVDYYYNGDVYRYSFDGELIKLTTKGELRQQSDFYYVQGSY